MTVIDFKDLSDHDIIDLSSSDDEIVQEDHIATKHRAASLDRQTMHVIAGVGIQDVQAAFVATSEGRQDVQALFAAASEGRQEAADCGYALEVTTSSLVTEKEPLVAASEGSQDVQAVLVAALEGSQDVQAAFVVASEGSQDVQAVLVATTEGRQEVAHSGNALEATASSLVTEKAPLDMAESHNCPRSPTSATFPSIFLYPFLSTVVCLSCKQSISSKHCNKLLLFEVNSTLPRKKFNIDLLQARLLPFWRLRPLKVAMQSW